MTEIIVRVTSIRSQNPVGYGGCIFSGRPIRSTGEVIDASSSIVVKASGTVLGRTPVQTGQWWSIAGTSTTRELEVNGYKLTETQVEAASAELLRPSGEHIITFIAANPAFTGIGMVKARRLWDCFGEALYELLDRKDVITLSQVLSADAARDAVEAWSQFGNTKTLQWLQAQGFPLSIGRNVLKFFGESTQEKIEQDPYRLLSFSASWAQVDALARAHFDVQPDDPRRLLGSIEEACYRIFAAGHTTALTSTVIDYLRGVLGKQTSDFPWRHLANSALSAGLDNGSYLVGEHGIQQIGAYAMERSIAAFVAARVGAIEERLTDANNVDMLIDEYQGREDIVLNEAQRSAVHLGASSHFALVIGGAGVGKTTVLKALYFVFDALGIGITQLALAGRAAMRMQQATGRPAVTIASFLKSAKPEDFGSQHAVVVDESSMVDVITMSRLVEAVGSRPKMLLVGDQAQLMPVGPGLVLHALVGVPQVPKVELTVVKRYGGAIAETAAAIRIGRWLPLPDDRDAPIAFLPCTNGESLGELVLDLYRESPETSKILCARKNSFDGTKHLNRVCQTNITAKSNPVRVWSNEHGCYAHTGLHLGDPVLCTRNLWDRGLQNGSLGVVVEVEDEPRQLVSEDGEDAGFALAWVEWDDGVRRPIVEELLDDIELGFAITVHKAQGSQWPRVIVPLTGHRLLDRTLVYTAVTRAQMQVILVGDEAAIRAAVFAPPRAQQRQVALDLMLRAFLASGERPGP